MRVPAGPTAWSWRTRTRRPREVRRRLDVVDAMGGNTVLVATATVRVVATGGQIHRRQLQQAGGYTGARIGPLGRDTVPFGDLLRSWHTHPAGLVAALLCARRAGSVCCCGVRLGQRRVAIVRPSTSLISARSKAAGSKPSALSRPSQSSMPSWSSWRGSASASFRSA
jgi:hypothetical protein